LWWSRPPLPLRARCAARAIRSCRAASAGSAQETSMRATKRSARKMTTGISNARSLRPGCGRSRVLRRLFSAVVAFLMVMQPAPGGFLWRLDLTAWAAVPWMINYQGRLTDTGDSAVTGTFTFTFRLYDDATAGAKQWEEEQAVSLVKS